MCAKASEWGFLVGLAGTRYKRSSHDSASAEVLATRARHSLPRHDRGELERSHPRRGFGWPDWAFAPPVSLCIVPAASNSTIIQIYNSRPLPFLS